jgi:formate hydrogenlyase regulatory protein HycA
MSVPSRIPIAREEGYHTDTIGKCEDGRQFMAFVVASMPLDKLRVPEGWQTHKRWHAVLHTFDKLGQHLHTEVWTAGTTADGEAQVIERAKSRLAEMLAKLGKVKYGGVKVSLFRVEVDGREFGLIDASEPEEDYESIHLLPNDLAFFEPWDGTYDT